jgi:photosystem II stability/assembly factor-like uncharacterized protein
MKILKSVPVLVLFMYLHTEVLMSQWTQVGLTTNRVTALAIGSNGYIYAGTYSNGVYVSTDFGTNWIPSLSPGLYNVYQVHSLIAGGDDTIYAGAHGNGLYRTTNSGSSWGNPSDLSGDFLPSNDVYAVGIAPNGILYASLYGEIYNSTDKGRNWYKVKNSSGGSAGFQTIAFGSSRVYIGGSSDWFYFSTNDGTNWTWEGSSSGLAYAPMTLAVNSSGTIFAGTSSWGLYKSTNGGINWTAVSTYTGDMHINTLAINSVGIIYAGTTGGIYVSTDNGLNWAGNNSGLTNTDIRSFAFDYLGNVYAGAFKSDGTGGLWRSTSILPVELTTFTVFEKEQTAVLRWSTATEMNSYGFEVERRTIGKSDWKTIGFIQSHGTSSTPHEYSFTDKDPVKGKYLYRLKQIDNDASFTYSMSVEVDLNHVPMVFSLAQNFPNPFNPSTTISFDLPANSFVSLKVFDVLGQEVTSIIFEEMPAGSYSRQWNAQNFPSGVYFYRLHARQTSGGQSGSFTQTKRLLLLK